MESSYKTRVACPIPKPAMRSRLVLLPPSRKESLIPLMEIQNFTEEIKAHAALFKLPGFAVAVVEDGKIVYRLNEGYADVEKQIPVGDDSIFPIASITKTFTAVMMM